MPTIVRLMIAALSGGISVLGWAPFEWWWFTLIGYGVLFWLTLNSRSALWAGSLGLVFGLSMHLAGHGWVLDTLRTKIGMALLPAAVDTLIFVAYLALFTAVPCLLWHVVAKPRTLIAQQSDAPGSRGRGIVSTMSAIASFSALLTLGEWMRSLFFNGFTSLSLGYSLIDPWLAGFAPVFGLYGLSWIGYCLSAVAALLVVRRTSRLVFLALIITVVGVGFGLNTVRWVSTAGTPLSYRLIQSNVVQQRKFDPLYVRKNMQRLVDAIEDQPADLVITPETAFPVFLSALPGDTLPRLQQFSKRTNSHVFLGIATSLANGESYNSVVQLMPDQSGMAQYNKVSLMPFGEYSPPAFNWFTSALNIPFKDLSAGARDQLPFTVRAQRIGTLICHEDLVGQELRRWLPDATVLINPSNLAWFEGSSAIGQRLQVVRMRALEAGRPILRITNTGITAHIDSRGVVVKRLPETQEAILAGTVQPMQGRTPYVLWGNWPVVLGCNALLLLILGRNRTRRLLHAPLAKLG